MSFTPPLPHRLLRDDRGAITVDWVILTASVVLFAAIAVGPVDDALDSVMASTVGVLGDVPEAVRLPVPEE